MKLHRQNLKKIGVSIDNTEPESLSFIAKKKAALSQRREQGTPIYA